MISLADFLRSIWAQEFRVLLFPNDMKKKKTKKQTTKREKSRRRL